MITRSKLPFAVRFWKGRSPKLFRHWVKDPSLLAGMKPSLELTENEDTLFSFEGPESFLFTMDGMDIVSFPKAIEVDGQSWIRASRRAAPFLLFEGKDFPLVPGYYVLTVTSGQENWYGLLEIRPKYLGKQSWENMKEELISEIKSLSFDFMRRHVHISRPMEGALHLNSSLLLQFYALSQNAGKVSRVLEELGKTANSRIVIQDERIRQGTHEKHVKPGSERDIEGTNQRRVKKIELTWDVAENRFVKHMVLSLADSIQSFLHHVESERNRIKTELSKEKLWSFRRSYKMNEEAYQKLGSYEKKANFILQKIRRVEGTQWFQETSAKTNGMLPMVVYRDPRYAALLYLIRNLKNPKQSLEVSSFYQFQWKRTDKLYELWCVLQFIKALLSKNWELEDGPVVLEEGGRYRLASLEPGTRITLSRGTERIHLVYDGLIPSSSADTSRETDPLYTNTAHRLPDLRLDFYNKNWYEGSLMADFKYRDLVYLWKDEARSAGLRRQFNAYRDAGTRFYQDMTEENSLRNSRPVKEVWAIFPREIPAQDDKDFSLRFLPLAPGLSCNEDLAERLEDYAKFLHFEPKSEEGERHV